MSGWIDEWVGRWIDGWVGIWINSKMKKAGHRGGNGPSTQAYQMSPTVKRAAQYCGHKHRPWDMSGLLPSSPSSSLRDPVYLTQSLRFLARKAVGRIQALKYIMLGQSHNPHNRHGSEGSDDLTT